MIFSHFFFLYFLVFFLFFFFFYCFLWFLLDFPILLLFVLQILLFFYCFSYFIFLLEWNSFFSAYLPLVVTQVNKKASLLYTIIHDSNSLYITQEHKNIKQFVFVLLNYVRQKPSLGRVATNASVPSTHFSM